MKKNKKNHLIFNREPIEEPIEMETKQEGSLKSLYLRVPSETATHLKRMAKRWNVSKNGYLNKLLREDLQKEIQSGTAFLEKVHQKIRG
jgi:predicted HicB family RNase H-like nuclease